MRFGISFYLVAMLFILFDIETIFLFPVGLVLALVLGQAAQKGVGRAVGRAFKKLAVELAAD